MNFEDLKNPELQEKLKNVKTSEELVEFARNQGVELTDEQLEAVSGGMEWYELCNGHGDCRTLPHQPV